MDNLRSKENNIPKNISLNEASVPTNLGEIVDKKNLKTISSYLASIHDNIDYSTQVSHDKLNAYVADGGYANIDDDEYAKKICSNSLYFNQSFTLENIIKNLRNERDTVKDHAEAGEKYRKLDAKKVKDFLEYIKNNDSVLSVRHGEQSTKTLEHKDGWQKKVEMMQLHQNMTDGVPTYKSKFEAFLLLNALKAVSFSTGKKVTIISSNNPRALNAIKPFINNAGIGLETNTVLDCINYSNNLSDKALKLLKESNGALSWNKEDVDEVCGANSFDNLTENTNHFIDLIKKRAKENNEIIVLLTHTQQLNIAGIKGRMGEFEIAAMPTNTIETDQKIANVLENKDAITTFNLFENK